MVFRIQFFVIDFANFCQKSDFRITRTRPTKNTGKTSTRRDALLLRFPDYLIPVAFSIAINASKKMQKAEEMKIEDEFYHISVEENNKRTTVFFLVLFL